MSEGATVTIRALRLDDVEAASDLLSRAFQDDPGARIIEPNDARRPAATRVLFAPVVRWAVPFGHVGGAFDGAGRLRGVATFVPPGHDTVSDEELAAAGQAEAVAVAPDAATRMETMVAFLEAQHARGIDGPHWRLEFYGVAPDAQGTGIGSRLIERGHAAADAAGERVWLETFTAENVAFYERRGYRVMIEGAVPGTPFTLWGLLREPRSASG